MNSVHEPGSRTMSKNLTQEKYRVEQGQKQAKCTKCTALASPCAQAARLPRPCCALAAAAPLLRASAALRVPLRAPALRLRLLSALRAQCASAPTTCAPPGHIVACLGTVLQYSPALPLLHSRNTLRCIAIQFQPSQPSPAIQ